MIFAVFVLIVSDVLIRLVGLKPWLYSSVLVEYGLLWFTMLATPWLARNKRHVFSGDRGRKRKSNRRTRICRPSSHNSRGV